MLTKSYAKNGKTCRVTFKLTTNETVENVSVLGEFNEWDEKSHPLTLRKDGTHSTTVTIEAGREYRFRYLLDGERWINDEAPDALVANRFGGQDCVVTV
jgi:1,4-alpha-glucan branching enzyme